MLNHPFKKIGAFVFMFFLLVSLVKGVIPFPFETDSLNATLALGISTILAMQANKFFHYIGFFSIQIYMASLSAHYVLAELYTSAITAYIVALAIIAWGDIMHLMLKSNREEQ